MQHAHCCLLCGQPCTHPNCRFTPLPAVQALVRQRCIATTLHYAAVLALPDAGRHMVCPYCINWRRRSRIRSFTRRRRGAKCRVYTPFDGMLIHALAPGFAEDPDRRCAVRLCGVLRDPANGYAGLVPAPVRAVLEAIAGPSAERADAVARAWWEVNERTPFFRHAPTARAVRQLHRAGGL
jgi:hypothetical protein